MAKTFGDLILEYQNYEYSKENYELTKEAYEIDLMNQYIESYEFASEEAPEYCTESAVFTEGYFIESNESSMDALYEAYNQKSEGFIKRIFSGMKNMIDKVVKFFKRLFNKEEDNRSKREKLIDSIKAHPVAILSALGIAAAGGAAGAYAYNKKKHSRKFTFSFDDTDAIPDNNMDKKALINKSSNSEESDDTTPNSISTAKDNTKSLTGESKKAIDDKSAGVKALPENILINRLESVYSQYITKGNLAFVVQSAHKAKLALILGINKSAFRGMNNLNATQLYNVFCTSVAVNITDERLIPTDDPRAYMNKINKMINRKNNDIAEWMGVLKKFNYTKGGKYTVDTSPEFKKMVDSLNDLSNMTITDKDIEGFNAKGSASDYNEALRNFNVSAANVMKTYSSVMRYQNSLLEFCSSILLK